MKDEIIAKLERGIASESTPDWARKRMQEQLDELLNPEPEPIQEQEPEQEPEPEPEPIKKKKVKPIKLPHDKYLKDNNIEIKLLPLGIRRKINGLRMFIGKDSEKVRAKAPEISNNIIEMIKQHLTPPPPPPKEFTAEEKQAMMEKYKSRRERKKVNEI